MSWAPFWLSLQIAVMATLIAGVVGVALATLLVSRRFPGRDLLGALVTAPMVVPPTALGYYLLVALGHRSWLGQTWESIFGSPIVFTRTGAVIAASVGALPLVVQGARAALDAVDPTLVATARTLGATRTRAYFTVWLPLARGGVAAALMLGFARSLGDFGLTYMVAGDLEGDTRTASIAIYNAVNADRYDDALGMVLLLTAIGLFALYGVAKLVRRERAA